MRFKLDENLPAEAADLLRRVGFVADTVLDENLCGADDDRVASTSRSARRMLITLDLDFANIWAYPPGEHPGIIVLRVKHQDKATVLGYLHRAAIALSNCSPSGELWIVDRKRISVRNAV